MTTHTYESHLLWEGTTGHGYRAYTRSHRAVAPPSTVEVPLSADTQFLGDPARINPEQMLVMAASSCQLLAFLALAATRGVDVRGYEDEAAGTMPQIGEPMYITTITLSPHIVVAAGTEVSHVEKLVHEAHESCYIANSLRGSVVVQPTVTVEAS